MFLSFILMFLLNILKDQNVFSIFQTLRQSLDFLRIKRTRDPIKLVTIAKNNSNWKVRKKAVESIKFNKTLMDIVNQDSNKEVRIQAIKNIDNDKILKEIVKNTENRDIREAALSKLKQYDANVEEYLELREKHFWHEI